jgi:hypothetical protein
LFIVLIGSISSKNSARAVIFLNFEVAQYLLAQVCGEDQVWKPPASSYETGAPQVKYFDKDGELELLQDKLDFLKLFQQANKLAWIRTDSASTPPFHTRSGFIRRTAYEIGYHIADEDLWEGFKCFLRSNIIHSKRPTTKQKIDNVECNPFYWCLKCIDGRVISDDCKVLMPHGRVPKLSRQLLLANEKKVDAKYVIGFTFQNGGEELREDGPIGSNWSDNDNARPPVDDDDDDDDVEGEGDWDEE